MAGGGGEGLGREELVPVAVAAGDGRAVEETAPSYNIRVSRKDRRAGQGRRGTRVMGREGVGGVGGDDGGGGGEVAAHLVLAHGRSRRVQAAKVSGPVPDAQGGVEAPGRACNFSRVSVRAWAWGSGKP